MISPRYVLPVILLVSLALVPTVIHSYMHARLDDGRTTATISTTLEGMSSQPYTRHNAKWVMDMFDSTDWIERIYQTDGGDNIRLFVARSYDHKRLYHHPELGLSHGSDLSYAGVVELPGEPNISVYLLRSGSGNGVVTYALLYDERFIRDPLKHQIEESLKLLVSARKPMTLFYVHGAELVAKNGFSETASAKLLRAAIRSYLSQK